MKNLINKYDSKNTLLVISLYPKKGELYSAGTSGVASYAKNIITNMNRRVVVLANYTDQPQTYEEDNILVIRCFTIGKPLMWLQILRNLRYFSRAQNILLQLDFAVYGSNLATALSILFLALTRLLGYKSSVVLHHVVMDIRKLSGHVGLNNGNLDNIKAFIYNALFTLFYRFLSLTAIRIFVLEETLRKRLITIIPKNKVITIPHGVDTNLTSVNKTQARRLLHIGKHEQVILFFGFINWFKGADIFVKMFGENPQNFNKKTRFIIAGGISPTLKEKQYYKTYYANVVKAVQSSEAMIEITGYVPQKKICLYFSAADLVVFPYRHFMTASGVMSLVFSYNKPFIVSNEIEEMFQAPDFIQSLKHSDLRKDDFVFDLKKDSGREQAEKVLKNGIRAKMRRFTRLMRKTRSYVNTAPLYEQALFPLRYN